jgi:hypothetical protein
LRVLWYGCMEVRSRWSCRLMTHMTEKTWDAIHYFLWNWSILNSCSELIHSLEAQTRSRRLELSNYINLDLHVYNEQRNERQAVQKMQISRKGRASFNQMLQMQI